MTVVTRPDCQPDTLQRPQSCNIQSMATCQCGHPDTDHKLRHACEEVIVYPSEEYPCSCERFAASMSDDCINCGHPLSLIHI